MVRSVSWFAKLHIFGDFMILLTICVILGYSGASVKNNGFLDNDAKLFNKSLWPNTIGFAIYSFEGIGVILPVQDITECKESYFKIICITCVLITVVYIGFSEFVYYAWVDKFVPTGPLITDYLPADSVFCWIVKILFCLQLIISYTLVIYPANMIVESHLYGNWPKSKKR